MIITRVELFKADIEFFEPFRISLGVSEAANNVFVRVHTDTGECGTGEASPFEPVTGETQRTALTVGAELARLLIGTEALDIGGATAAMAGYISGNSSIRSAFDMALYDIAGRVAGLPLYALLGGDSRVFETDNTVGMDSAQAMAGKAAEFVADGFRAIKVKLGTGFEEDVARVSAMRAAVGPRISLRLDANQGWDYPTAVRVLRAIEPLEIEYCEQPLRDWDVDNMRRLRDVSSIPIMADESVMDHHDAMRLAAGDYCDYLNIKLAKSGGIHTGLQIAAIADASGLACMVGCMSETRLGLTAAAHLVAARPVIRFADLDSHVDHRVDPVQGGMQIVSGEVHLPDSPGIGAEIAPGFLASCERTTIE